MLSSVSPSVTAQISWAQHTWDQFSLQACVSTGDHTVICWVWFPGNKQRKQRGTSSISCRSLLAKGCLSHSLCHVDKCVCVHLPYDQLFVAMKQRNVPIDSWAPLSIGLTCVRAGTRDLAMLPEHCWADCGSHFVFMSVRWEEVSTYRPSLFT